MNTLLVVFFGVAFSFSLAGCGGDKSPPEASDTGSVGSATGCAADETAEPFTLGMHEDGKNGVRVSINSDPPVPTLGDHSRWMLAVTDSTSSQAVPDDTQVSLRCVMTHTNIPSHGCPVTPSVTNKGSGMYEAYPVIFNMAGHWEVDVKAGTLDTVTFQLCIE